MATTADRGGSVRVPAGVPSALRRALRRARDGSVLDQVEATVLLSARGEPLEELLTIASAVRDAGLVAEGRPGVVTYSRKVFVPLTRLCRDRCRYCTFATVPGRVPAAYLERDEVLEIARSGAAAGCKEALFTLGDRPEERWPAARRWLRERGYSSTVDYLRSCAIAVLEETGLLPHLNPGVLTWDELLRLRPVAPSMGMMLETTARRLWADQGGPHFGSPDKEPAVRLRVLTDAGRVGVPFTSGLLAGIGETAAERVETLFELRRVARAYGHLQEVIIQNFRSKPDTAMRGRPDLATEEMAATVAVARLVLGPGIRLQAPPNLLAAPGEDLDAACAMLLRAGIDDWGGVSPVTPDHVNPERPWPHLADLARRTEAGGFALTERLTVYPRYVRAAEQWIDPRLHRHVLALAARETGLALVGVAPVGVPWQEPDGGLVTIGRSDLHTAVDGVGRSADRRGDFDTVYGDWASVSGDRPATNGAPVRLGADLRKGLRLAATEPAALLEERNSEAALAMFSATGDGLAAVVAAADGVRRDVVGEAVTFVVNRNINFTNICYIGCRFCAFAQRRSDADAYRLSVPEVADRAEEAWSAGATEVCLQGGIDPELPVSGYSEIVRAIKARVPDIHVHAFSPMEIVTAAAKAGVSVTEWLTELKNAGLDTIPGTAAEILDDDVRWILTKGKLPAATWLDVVGSAHRLGLRSSATMMYGHVDNPAHWLAHLRTIARQQDESGGFTEFVPLPFVHHNAPLYLAGLSRPGPTADEDLAVHAMSRLLLHGRIDQIQCSWVKLGDAGAAASLCGGANDLGGTLMEETISRMAGSEHGSSRTPDALRRIAALAGRPAVQRTTVYGPANAINGGGQGHGGKGPVLRAQHAGP